MGKRVKEGGDDEKVRVRTINIVEDGVGVGLVVCVDPLFGFFSIDPQLQDMALDEVVHDQGEVVAREEDADIKETGHLVPDGETREDVKTFDDDDLVTVSTRRVNKENKSQRKVNLFLLLFAVVVVETTGALFIA